MKENQKKTTSFSSTDSYQADKRIDLLFSKFAAFYGHVWRSQFKNEVFFKFAKKEWCDALSEFTDEVLTQAILNCREFYEMPPTLPQVVKCCKQLKQRTIVNFVTEAYVPATSTVALTYLLQCKKFLAK